LNIFKVYFKKIYINKNNVNNSENFTLEDLQIIFKVTENLSEKRQINFFYIVICHFDQYFKKKSQSKIDNIINSKTNIYSNFRYPNLSQFFLLKKNIDNQQYIFLGDKEREEKLIDYFINEQNNLIEEKSEITNLSEKEIRKIQLKYSFENNTINRDNYYYKNNKEKNNFNNLNFKNSSNQLSNRINENSSSLSLIICNNIVKKQIIPTENFEKLYYYDVETHDDNIFSKTVENYNKEKVKKIKDNKNILKFVDFNYTSSFNSSLETFRNPSYPKNENSNSNYQLLRKKEIIKNNDYKNNFSNSIFKNKILKLICIQF